MARRGYGMAELRAARPRRPAGPRRPGQLLDAELHQLAASGLRPCLVAGRPGLGLSRLRAHRTVSLPVDAGLDESRAYQLPERLPLNQWALGGQWTIGRENLVLDQARGSIAFRFAARDAHLVLSTPARKPIPFRVLLDGQAPGPSHGVDVDEGGNGLLQDGRMYQLVRERDTVRQRTLQITFLEPGAEAYAFTFG